MHTDVLPTSINVHGSSAENLLPDIRCEHRVSELPNPKLQENH